MRNGALAAIAPNVVRLPRIERSSPIVLAIALVAGVAIALSGCGKANKGPRLGPRVIPLGQPVPKGGGHYKVGQAYRINGVTYTPNDYSRYDRVGTASWYGELFHGRYTANGEIYDMDRLSAAHPTLPLPVYARVTNLENRRSIVVRVNDRGPYARGREIDLSKRSAQALGFFRQGTAPVRVTYMGKAPMSGDDTYERRVLAGQSWHYAAADDKDGKTATVANETAVVKAQRRVASRAAPTPSDAMTVGSISKPAETSSGGAILIQAGSFKSKDNAERAKRDLAGVAPVLIDSIGVGGETYFRVRVGPFRDRGAADGALERIRGAGHAGARIVVQTASNG